MAKKEYHGLDAEIIMYGEDTVGTVTFVPDASTCILGNVTNWLSDEDDTPMPLGQCFYFDDTQFLSVNWNGQGGSTLP